jgi:alkylation response protein AidB-like acyl-CoA dehydrogenase
VNFEFDAEQEQLRASVRRYLVDRAPITPYVRDGYGAARGADDVWLGLAALGASGLLVRGDHGGAGVGMVDAAVVLEECGRAVYPGPYVSSAIGATSLVSLAGGDTDHAALLPALADGTTVGTLAIFERGDRIEWRAPTTRCDGPGSGAEGGDGTVRVSGTKVGVLDGERADVFLVSTRADDGEVAIVAVTPGPSAGSSAGPSVRVEPDAGLDGSRCTATVHFDGAVGRRLAGADPTSAVGVTLDRMRTALVIDSIGAAARALELTVAYATARVAFDKPIGSFQAVQHLCADMLRALELSRAAGYYACWALDDADAAHAHLAAVQAAAYTSEELPKLGAHAIQVFGGIGFTWEHDIHLFYKRLVSAGAVLGNADDHLAELADLVLSPALIAHEE